MPKSEGGTVIVTVSTEVKSLIDRLIVMETKRTGYPMKARDIVGRAVTDLSIKLHVPVVKETEKVIVKPKRRKWTEARLKKFRKTMAAKKVNGSVNPVDSVDTSQPVFEDMRNFIREEEGS